MPRTAASDPAARNVGREVRRARLAAGLTQSALASELGTNSSYVANLEAGRLNLTVGQLARVAGAIGADLEVSLASLDVVPTAVAEPPSRR
jgi:transcriptional regulator with XRE-family HTH domain